MRWILAATFLLGFTDAEQSQAFEAWGFKSGITTDSYAHHLAAATASESAD
jgi:hypothetical protein